MLIYIILAILLIGVLILLCATRRKELKEFIMKLDLSYGSGKAMVNIVLAVLAALNFLLAQTGHPIIEFNSELITTIVNGVIMALFIIRIMWKNTPITVFGKYADRVLQMLKDGKISFDELQEFLDIAEGIHTDEDLIEDETDQEGGEQ